MIYDKNIFIIFFKMYIKNYKNIIKAVYLVVNTNSVQFVFSSTPRLLQTSLTEGQKLGWVRPSFSSPGQSLELLHSSSP